MSEEVRIQGICSNCKQSRLDCVLVWTNGLFLDVFCPECAPHRHRDVWEDLRAHITKRLRLLRKDHLS